MESGGLARYCVRWYRHRPRAADAGRPAKRRNPQMRGAGRVVFIAFLLLLVGILNIIYGIGAIADANFYVNDTRLVLTNLHAMGWVLIILGVIQLTGGFSLMA